MYWEWSYDQYTEVNTVQLWLREEIETSKRIFILNAFKYLCKGIFQNLFKKS